MGNLAIIIQIHSCLFKKKTIQVIKVKNIYTFFFIRNGQLLKNKNIRNIHKNLMRNVISKIVKATENVERNECIGEKIYLVVIYINHNGQIQ